MISENVPSFHQKLQGEIAKLRKDKEAQQESIGKLHQEIKDNVGDKKLHEKKGLTMVCDVWCKSYWQVSPWWTNNRETQPHISDMYGWQTVV